MAANAMTPQEFIAKWRRSRGQESAGAQEWFLDLCRLVEHHTPAELDPRQEWYTFERAVRESSGQRGRADVYKRSYFAWEFKGLHRDLDAAYAQLQRYREALGNPPALVVSDFVTIRVHTNFTNTVPAVHTIALDDLGEPEQLSILRSVFHDPDVLKPAISPDDVTRETASIFSRIARSMRERNVDSLEIARFLNRLVFCFFAQDVGLLPDRVLTELCERFFNDPEEFDSALAELFCNMKDGGRFGFHRIRYFNGDLFNEPDTVLMSAAELEDLAEARHKNWAHIEPSIFGTLFERVIDPEKQNLIGAQYTSVDDIRSVIDPVMMQPLRQEWSEVERTVGALMLMEGSRDEPQARALLQEFQNRLASLKVLDPASGSGNFLYVALQELRDLEKQVLRLAADLGLRGFLPEVSPEQFHGIEIDSYATDLARTALWIGHLQWSMENGYRHDQEPVLGSLNTIECRDAIIDLTDPENPKEAQWPAVDYIVGNPPFLGSQLIRGRLHDEYTNHLFRIFADRIPNYSDYCCYWFEKARDMVETAKTSRVGLLATQGIRGGANRRVLERIKTNGDIFLAHSDRPWILDGAAVHVSIVGFDDGTQNEKTLNGVSVGSINADLTAGADLTEARKLAENSGRSFIGDMKKGKFEIDAETAANMILQVGNPNGRPNSDVLRPWVNALDITRRSREMWIIDFGLNISEHDAAQYEKPFEYLEQHVKPFRETVRNPLEKRRWWIHGRTAPDFRLAVSKLDRYIATPRVAKHRLFVFLSPRILPDGAIVAVISDQDFDFGVLHSHHHELWALAMGTQLESRPRYTPTTCFETFPFPQPTEGQREAIATTAAELNRLRENWLNPVDMFGNPALNADQLRRRTLTNLYNDYPTWLANAHATLDAAVADAYGWPPDLPDAEVLERLLALNLEQSAAEREVNAPNSSDSQ